MVSVLKKMLALLLALCLCLGLMAGCGSQNGSTATDASSAAGDIEDFAPPASAMIDADEDEAETADVPEEDSAVEASAAEEETAAVGEGDITAYAAEIFGTDEVPEAVSYPLDTDDTLELMATFPDPLFASYPNGMADCLIYQEAEKATGVKMTYTPPVHFRFRGAVQRDHGLRHLPRSGGLGPQLRHR